MLQNKSRLVFVGILLSTILITILFSLKSVHQTSQLPTINVNQVRTEAVVTFVIELTDTAESMPTDTETITPLPIPTKIETNAISSTPSCYRLKYIKDITIPDNTSMTPAQVFTKTWLVENSGLCVWRVGFKLVLVGGLAMGGSPFILTQPANPGDRIEISVKMAAPTSQTGILQGTWRMTDENGMLFGDALTVVIDIGGSNTNTPNPPEVKITP